MQNNKLDISVVLPIKGVMKDFDDFFSKAILSITKQSIPISELVIVHTDEDALIQKLNEYDFGDLSVQKVKWTLEPNFSDQVNIGFEKSTSKWVSILEIDDEYSFIWFKNVKKYMEAFPNVDGFLPIVIDVDNKGAFAGFTNEATFAANFSQEMSILNNDMLQNYQNFQTSGLVLKKEKIEEYGGFKPNMKLSFPYEFLLRMTYNSVLLKTIPRIGYKHTNQREGSIFWEYKYSNPPLTQDEIKFWIDSAKKEYFFTVPRDINYVPVSKN